MYIDMTSSTHLGYISLIIMYFSVEIAMFKIMFMNRFNSFMNIFVNKIILIVECDPGSVLLFV